MMKKTKLIVSTLVMVASMGFTAYAGQWQQDTIGWWYQNDDGSYPANGWQWIDGNGDGVSESYYFDANGYLLSNTTTPDGYTVNADGAWVVNGVVQTQGTAQASVPQLSAVTSTPTTVLGEGTYKVGTDIAAGDYILFCNSEYSAYYSINSDSSGSFSSIITNGNFKYNAIVHVDNGQYLELDRCTISPLSEVPQIDYTKGEMFKVGYHIPAGEYKLQSNSEYSGYYAVLNSLSGSFSAIETNDNFKGQAYITVHDGQYLELSRCNIVM